MSTMYGNPLGGYGMGYAGGGIIGMLMLVLGIAAIALAVILYMRFLGKNSAPNRTTKWGRFFNFDHLYLEKIVKALYLFSTVFITVASVSIPLLSVTAVGTGDAVDAMEAFLAGVVTGILFFLVNQFVARMAYESFLMFVRQAVDVRALRVKVAGEPCETGVRSDGDAPLIDMSAIGVAVNGARDAVKQRQAVDSAANGAPAAPATPANSGWQGQAGSKASTGGRASSGTDRPANPAGSEWTCMNCGAANHTGRFCYRCGAPR